MLDPHCYSETSSERERHDLILEHLHRVRDVARRIHRRLPPSVSLDDLASTGVVGLIAAIDRFDPSRGVTLKTYAEHKIRGAIFDSLRRLDWATRRQRKQARQIQAAVRVLEQLTKRPPAEEEIAARLNLSLDEYRQWQLQTSTLNFGTTKPAEIEHSEGGDLLRLVSNDADACPSAVFERNELRRILAAAVSGIPDIEQTILRLHYIGELKLREISKILGLHESRIYQLRSHAILRIRVYMAKRWPVGCFHKSGFGWSPEGGR